MERTGRYAIQIIGAILLMSIILAWIIYSRNQLIIGTTGFDVGRFGDSFGVINGIIGFVTLILVGLTYFHQKETLDEQIQEIKNQKFREFVKFLLEGLSVSIKEIRVIGNTISSKGTIAGEDAIVGLKYGAIQSEGTLFSGISKEVWLKHGGLNKIKTLLKDINFIEEYIENNYKGTNLERKEYYYRLIRNRISFNLYERIMEEETKEEAKKLKTFKDYEQI